MTSANGELVGDDMTAAAFRHHCSKIRRKEGSGQGWLVETRVILLLFLINLNRCALCASSVHQLSRLSQRSLSAFVLAVSLVTDHVPESPLCLSLNSCSTVAFIWSPRQLLQTQVFLILHLTHLLTAVS